MSALRAMAMGEAITFVVGALLLWAGIFAILTLISLVRELISSVWERIK